MRNLLLILLISLSGIQVFAQGGSSCAEAVAANEISVSTNTSDHTGDIEQWFTYTATMNGKITISNCGATTEDTNVQVYTACGVSIPLVSNDNYCNSQSQVVFQCTTGSTYYIRWRISISSTNKAYNWTLTEEAAEQGDFCDDPKSAIIGSNLADHSSGADQWYTYTAVNTGKLKLTTCDQTTEDTFVEVYNSCDGYPISYNNNSCNYQSSLILETTAGNTYLIKWKSNNISGSYNWILTDDLTEQGDFCDDPFIATTGTNQCDHSTGVNQWFAYTASVTGEIIVSSCSQTSEDTYVEVYEDCSTLLSANNDYCSTQSQLAFSCTQGETYYVKWSNTYTSGSYNWTLTENEDTEGYYCESAYTAIEGTNNCDHSTGYDQWFAYTPESNGRVTISSCGLTTENTSLEIYKGCDESVYLQINNSCSTQESATFQVYANETYYIRWKKTYTSGTYNWSLSREDLNPGEECSQALSCNLGDNSTTHTSDYDQWYEFTSSEDGILVIKSCDLTEFDTKLEIYNDCNTLIESADDECGFQTQLSYAIADGETIYIRWLGEKAVNKTYNWNLSYDYSTSLLSNNNTAISVYPNPNKGNFNIDLSTLNEDALTLFLVDISGNTIHKQSIQGNKNQLISIPYISIGLYTILLKNEHNYIIFRDKVNIIR